MKKKLTLAGLGVVAAGLGVWLASDSPLPEPPFKPVTLAWDPSPSPGDIVYDLREGTNITDPVSTWTSYTVTGTQVTLPGRPQAFYIVRAWDRQVKLYSDWNIKTNNL